jgi:hypothetical protein
MADDWTWPDGYTPVTVQEAIQILDRSGEDPAVIDGLAGNLELGHFIAATGPDGGLNYHITPAGEQAVQNLVFRRESGA